MIIPSNLCYQWAIEYSVESVDIMRSYTLSQGYDKYIKCALCALYHALSLAISLYLAMRHFCAVSLHQRNAPSPLPFKIITAHPLTLSPPAMTLSSLNIKLSTLPSHPFIAKSPKSVYVVPIMSVSFAYIELHSI